MNDNRQGLKPRSNARMAKRSRQSASNSKTGKLPRKLSLELINSTDVALIHQAVLTILSEVGVIIDHQPTRNMLVKHHGCHQGSDEYIRMPTDLVNHAISSVPETLKLYDLEGNLKVDSGSNTASYSPGHNCVRLLDHRSGELRSCLLSDIKEIAKVCDKLPNIDVVGSLGYPSDIPPEDEVVETTRALFENSSKPALLLAHDEHIQKRMMDVVADLAGGWNRLAEKPISLELMGPVSPLKMPEDLCLRLINCARWRVPVVCYPATFPGMSCPISSAGAIAQSSAEAIAGIVIHQLTEPGAPILTGSAILPMDLRQANLAYGSPEYMLTGVGASDYFRSIGIPSWIGAGCSDSHQFDAQAAAEAGSSLTIAAMAGTAFIHNLGYLSGGQTGSLEMLTLCDELVGWTNKMAAGIEVNAETLAVEVVKRAAPDNDFLTDAHTQERFLTENWYPNLFERSDADAWQQAGAADMSARIRSRLADILRQ
ncbi:MAG: trimethylamine--corrinoid protein Co-methyltransferase [Gammaproteobacteria bacterium]|jgi:trimethylamine--corrinoid protein Co-methyltransferase